VQYLITAVVDVANRHRVVATSDIISFWFGFILPWLPAHIIVVIHRGRIKQCLNICLLHITVLVVAGLDNLQLLCRLARERVAYWVAARTRLKLAVLTWFAAWAPELA
jgi:hypothetical protein